MLLTDHPSTLFKSEEQYLIKMTIFACLFGKYQIGNVNLK